MSIDSGKHFGDFVKQFVKGSAVEKLSTGGPPKVASFTSWPRTIGEERIDP